jgi:hypothetical protein
LGLSVWPMIVIGLGFLAYIRKPTGVGLNT